MKTNNKNAFPRQPLLICYFISVRVRNIEISVCLSVCLHTSKTTHPNFSKFSAHVTCGRGSVLL